MAPADERGQPEYFFIGCDATAPADECGQPEYFFIGGDGSGDKTPVPSGGSGGQGDRSAYRTGSTDVVMMYDALDGGGAPTPPDHVLPRRQLPGEEAAAAQDSRGEAPAPPRPRAEAPALAAAAQDSLGEAPAPPLPRAEAHALAAAAQDSQEAPAPPLPRAEALAPPRPRAEAPAPAAAAQDSGFWSYFDFWAAPSAPEPAQVARPAGPPRVRVRDRKAGRGLCGIDPEDMCGEVEVIAVECDRSLSDIQRAYPALAAPGSGGRTGGAAALLGDAGD